MLWNILLIGWDKLPQVSIPNYFHPSLVADRQQERQKGPSPCVSTAQLKHPWVISTALVTYPGQCDRSHYKEK